MKAPNYLKNETKVFEVTITNPCLDSIVKTHRTIFAKQSGYFCFSTNSAIGANGLRRPNELYLHRAVWEIQKPLTGLYQYDCVVPGSIPSKWLTATEQYINTEQSINASLHLLPVAVSQESIDKAVSKFYADVSDIKFNFAVFAIELAKTRDMVAARAWQIGRSYKLLRQGKIGQAFAQFTTLKQNKVPIKGDKPLKGKDLADAWLEMRYGWSPLMYEIQGAIELLEEKILGGKLAHSYSKTTKSSYTDKSTVGPSSGIICTHNATINDHVTISCLIKPENPSRIILEQLGFDNPALIAYELMPYSFVVDWFYNIGDYLQSQTALAGLSLDYTSITKTRYLQDEITITDAWNYPGSKPEYEGRHTYFSKLKLRELNIPQPPMPTFGVNMDWKRLLDSLAMLSQQNGKFGK